jgi:pyridoxal phosphate enzyme (YggS family)
MNLADRLDGVRDRVARAARRAGRSPDDVRLIAVSKTFPATDVRAAAQAGQLDFGENKVQEALQKMQETADLPLRWHLVGHLQSNKARKAATAFHVVHSIDTEDIARRLDDAAAAAGRTIDMLIQVDVAGELTKHGARPGAVRRIVEVAATCRAARLRGLMLLPPAGDTPEAARPHFVALRKFRDELATAGVDPAMLADLSMGMSHDFEVAVEEGATLIRVGTAIFGDRGKPADASVEETNTVR